ncbi:SulP family inorganic anion transporter [Comamonas sp. JC664]|uniref:SulP family inorganic anion transporter n=1 Tax=Comamonas sp. JC664 TaxID=2801917 RepID=UPI001747E100|nr:SulP family inorganic anion transporter [Comamonas sp. JC664]MBL0696607.1 SulP family inorganic anion transporter [Comamonas sp. JC664]GHG85067.1 MFS transporter [Comamonas sp. KCTC 72670]
MVETPTLKTPQGWMHRPKQLWTEWKEMVSPRTLPSDASAALTVACVALPLNLALAVASGLPPEVGLISGAVAGVIAALLGGGRLQVTGPEAALVPTVLLISTKHGVAGVVVATLLCGALQVLLGFARAGRLAQFMPAEVTRGFTAGIGLLLLDGQLPRLLGAVTEGTSSARLLVAPASWATWSVHWGAVAVGAVVVACMLLIPKLHRSIPAVLVGLVLATLASGLGFVSEGLARVGALPTGLPLPVLPSFEALNFGALLPDVLALTVLASLGSLLSARALDQLPGLENHRTDGDQELVAQGVGNTASALFGGMPVMGAIVRSSVSVQAGGRTRAASVLHAVMLLAACILAGALVAMIPMAALAAILVVVGTRLLDLRGLRALMADNAGKAAVAVATALLIASIGFLPGLAAGVVLSLARSFFSPPKANVRSLLLREDGRPLFRSLGSGGENLDARPPVQLLRVRGDLDVRSCANLSAALQGPPWPRHLVLDLSDVKYMDAAGLRTIRELSDVLAVRGGRVLVAGARGGVAAMLQEAGTWTGSGPHALMSSMDEVIESIKQENSRESTGRVSPTPQAT